LFVTRHCEISQLSRFGEETAFLKMDSC
jgi:hypothetical protein